MGMLKVMLADDEVTIIEGFRRLFDWEKHGCTVVCEAGDGITAVNLAKEFCPDIVLMDINMPLLSGLEAIGAISGCRPQTAFIVVSGYNEFEYARAALRLSVADYLLKPVKFEELGRTVDALRLALLNRAQGAWGEAAPADEKQVYKIISFINENMSREISLDILSATFHMTPAYISQLFKSETGMNYYAYLSAMRINRAKKLLATTDRSITEIAMDVGFHDYRVFAKAFKQREHMLPSAWKKGQRQRDL